VLRVVDDGYLVVDEVPYVTPEIKPGISQLVVPLTLQGNKTSAPDTHVAYWCGAHPHMADGGTLDALLMPNAPRGDLGASFASVYLLSAKTEYRDYYHKVSTYYELLSREARKLEAELAHA